MSSSKALLKREIWLKIRASLDRGVAVCSVHRQDSPTGLLGAVCDDGKVIGDVPSSLLPDCRTTLQSRKPGLISRDGQGFFLDPLNMPPCLTIFGAGHIARALAPLAVELNFHVTVVDNRRGFATSEFFQGCRLLCGPYPEVVDALDIDAASYLVIVTHGHQHDQECLEGLIDKNYRYLGMIGSRAKVSKLLNNLADKGVDIGLIRRIHAPIGMDIAAETPQEIAISIMAEMVAVKNGRNDSPAFMSMATSWKQV